LALAAADEQSDDNAAEGAKQRQKVTASPQPRGAMRAEAAAPLPVELITAFSAKVRLIEQAAHSLLLVQSRTAGLKESFILSQTWCCS
jgi:hypothetical protein